MFGSKRKIQELETENSLLQSKIKELENDKFIFEKFQENFPIPFFAIDSNRNIITFNSEFSNLTGFDTQEIKNSTGAAVILWPINPPECKVCKLVTQFVKQQKSGYGEAFITSKQSEVIPVYVYVVPIYKNNELKQTYILLRDQRDEVQKRKEYMKQEASQVINTLQSIVDGKFDEKLQLNDNSELKLLEKPTNNIRQNLQSIVDQLVSSTSSVTDITTLSLNSLDNVTDNINVLTQNVKSNTQEISQMLNYTKEVTNSLKNEEELANKTVESMDQINEQVNMITDAIVVIDQIAFQTNILSLNAAVEAATAGEAGKGFAVVAQEVRNLATRSADAANEIKQIVGNATAKANDGKKISTNMIDGFKQLNESITKTTQIIEDVTMKSKQQQNEMQVINSDIDTLSTHIKDSSHIIETFQNETFNILHIK